MAELARRIDSQELAPGALLPGETGLADEFGVTRMTVRQALAGLAAAGLVERRHGHGTMVAPIKLRRQPDASLGLADELLARGIRPGSHVLEFERVSPDEATRSALWVGPRGKVNRVLRLRYANDILIGLQESWIPVTLAPALEGTTLEGRSLMQLLRERHGLIASHAAFDIQAVGADRRVAELLGIEPRAPMLQTTNVTYLEGGRPLERTVGWFIGSRYSFQVHRGGRIG